MRLLLATDFYPPFIGGAERQIQILAIELAARGHEVHVATLWHAGLAADEMVDGVHIHRLKALSTRLPWLSKDASRRFHPPFPDVSITLSLIRLIRQYHIHLVHASGWIAYSCSAASLVTKAPVVVTAMDYGYSCAVRTLQHNNAELCSGPQFTKCLACAARNYGAAKAFVAVTGIYTGRSLLRRHTIHALSHYVKHIVERDLRPQRGAVTLAPPVISQSDALNGTTDEETERFTGLLPAEPYIFFIGALRKFKGIYELLQAYTQLVSAPPLVLVGSTWPESPTEFPANVILIKNAPRKAVMKIAERALFCVAPSTYPEPFGGVVLEAMIKGKAVIGNVESGQADMIVDGHNGFLLDPHDVAALRHAMQTLIDDIELRERFGAAARQTAEALTTERLIPQYEALFQSIASGQVVG